MTPRPAAKQRKACPVLCLGSTGEVILLLRAQLCQHPESELERPNPLLISHIVSWTWGEIFSPKPCLSTLKAGGRSDPEIIRVKDLSLLPTTSTLRRAGPVLH